MRYLTLLTGAYLKRLARCSGYGMPIAEQTQESRNIGSSSLPCVSGRYDGRPECQWCGVRQSAIQYFVWTKVFCAWQDERAAQLRHLARLSALVTGFALASFLQFNFDVNSVQSGVLMAYAATTALVVSSSKAWTRSALPALAVLGLTAEKLVSRPQANRGLILASQRSNCMSSRDVARQACTIAARAHWSTSA